MSREFLSLTDLQIEREFWTLHYWNLEQEKRASGGEMGPEISEFAGDEAYAEYVAKLEREAEQDRQNELAKRDEDFIPIREEGPHDPGPS